MREEIVGGNACGGKPGSLAAWRQGDIVESCIGSGAISIASLSPQASIAAKQ